MMLYLTVVVLLVVAWRGYRHYHVCIRQQRLGDESTVWKLGKRAFVVSLLRKGDEHGDAKKAKRAFQRLITRYYKGEAQFVYFGQVVHVLIESKQVEKATNGNVSYVLVTEWSDLAAFDGFLRGRNDFGLEVLASQGFTTFGWAELLLGPFFKGIKYFNKLRGAKVDLASNIAECKKRDWVRALGAVDGKAPLLVWNWILNSSDKSKRAQDQEYGVKMIQMVAQHDSGIIHIGKPVNNKPNSNFTGTFDAVIGMCYWDVDFAKTILESSWFQETIEAKTVQDTLAVATIPVL